MKISLIRLALCLFVLVTAVDTVCAKAWRGIEPLHSTRSDVERLIGPPNFDGSIYDFPEERAWITYATGKCEDGLPGGWNVPKDTVIEIYSHLSSGKQLSDLLIPGKDYQQTRAAHTPHIYYTDPDEGIQFGATGDIVWSISYFPSAKDKRLSCGDYKFAVPVDKNAKLNRVEQVTFDSYGNIRFEDAKARLDNFVIQLFELMKMDSRWRGYIIVYAGRRSYLGEAQYKADCAKNYLVRVRNMAAENIFAVDGGFREQMEVALYISRSDDYPPMLVPSVSPKKVQVIKRRLKNCAKLSPRSQ